MFLCTRKLATRRSRIGFTITEMMVAIAVGAVVLAGLASFIVYTARSFAAMANYADLEYASRNALDRITSSVRQTRGLHAYTPTKLTLMDTNPGSYLYFEYLPDKKLLTQTQNGQTTILLRDCTALRFTIAQRTPKWNQWDVYTLGTNQVDLCKVVQVTWICSKALFGSSLFNTEVVQTTKIVIRDPGTAPTI